VNYPVEDPTDETTVGVRTSTYTYSLNINGLYSNSYTYTYNYNQHGEFGLDLKHEQAMGIYVPSYCLQKTETIAPVTIALVDPESQTIQSVTLNVYDGPPTTDPQACNDFAKTI
jgi:hypothetical protein